jgi:hypothetical protein
MGIRGKSFHKLGKFKKGMAKYPDILLLRSTHSGPVQEGLETREHMIAKVQVVLRQHSMPLTLSRESYINPKGGWPLAEDVKGLRI